MAIGIGAALVLAISGMWLIAADADERYEAQLSVIVYDRQGVPLSIRENNRGHYVNPLQTLPPDFTALLIGKEDRWFWYHPGINPISSLRAAYDYLTTSRAGGSSTLTQQLAKNLLGTESDRTLANKLMEAVYALSIELFTDKEEVLLMYANTVYLGNQVQGFNTGSEAYFNKSLADTTHNEQLALLATLSYPSARNPWEPDNSQYATALNKRLSPSEEFLPPVVTGKYSFQSDTYFELRTAGITCTSTCSSTVDEAVTKTIRDILNRHINHGWSKNIRNGAVVVLRTSDAELLSMVGSRDPNNVASGNQINMALEPRPIGSTVKPFIYAKGFQMGLRPYTLVEDREYKYPIATGFSLYPKNYDGLYHGEVTLHEALSNSLNVPSVKVLEYIGLEQFYAFLSDGLGFQPIQDYDSYQYGIALGGLEMDLLTLTHYFTLFPNHGTLKPLSVLLESDEHFSLPPQSDINENKRVIEAQYIELVHTIISDRFTGVNQFGLESNLNLPTSEYAVKTGTSRDFHDSWVIGYTPDLVVGVWLGNVENEPLEHVSGQSGAGAVWHDVMTYLLTTPYVSDKQFERSDVEQFSIGLTNEWGLSDDIVSEHRDLLLKNNLILSLHDGDTFERVPGVDTYIPLKARKEVVWQIDGTQYARGTEASFTPSEARGYEVAAYDEEQGILERVMITVTDRE